MIAGAAGVMVHVSRLLIHEDVIPWNGVQESPFQQVFTVKLSFFKS